MDLPLTSKQGDLNTRLQRIVGRGLIPHDVRSQRLNSRHDFQGEYCLALISLDQILGAGAVRSPDMS